MKKIILLLSLAILTGLSAMAQTRTVKTDSTDVIDRKGTIKWTIKNVGSVITNKDSTLYYVTPSQLNDSLKNALTAENGLTKTDKRIELGGILNKPTTIETTAANFLAITGLAEAANATDTVITWNPVTGQLQYMTTDNLLNQLNFSNGLTKTGNEVKLGGALTEATTITTDATNVLQINGLQSGSLATDSLVVANATDGTLKRVAASSLLQSGEEQVTATAGQTAFTVANMPANPSRVWVYRNGAKLLPTVDYTVAAGSITFTDNEFTNVAGDVIEVQWVK